MIMSKEFIKYCLVGIINTLVGISTSLISLDFFMLSYAVSNTLAYITGSIVSFFMNKKFTFKNTDKAEIQFIKFFLTMLPTYGISYFLGWFIAPHIIGISLLNPIFCKIAEFLNMNISHFTDNIAVFISMVIYLLAGFSINKFFVFKK